MSEQKREIVLIATLHFCILLKTDSIKNVIPNKRQMAFNADFGKH